MMRRVRRQLTSNPAALSMATEADWFRDLENVSRKLQDDRRGA